MVWVRISKLNILFIKHKRDSNTSFHSFTPKQITKIKHSTEHHHKTAQLKKKTKTKLKAPSHAWPRVAVLQSFTGKSAHFNYEQHAPQKGTTFRYVSIML